jgi:hypothetical protein
VQLPPVHSVPAPQDWHWAPAAPQDSSVVPGRHCAAEQQPVVQVVGSQVQTPPPVVLSQAVPGPQLAHWAPAAPH